MGIFDSLKDELKEHSLSSEKVLQKIRTAGVNTNGITVQIAKDVVTLTGVVGSEVDKVKAARAADETEGVNSVINKLTVVPQSDDSKEDDSVSDIETYTVKSGDTLSGIAKKFYGNAGKYPQLFEHNKQVWADNGKKQDPNILFPGWVLEIPKL